MIKSFEEKFRANINVQLDSLTRALVEGRITNYEDYESVTGQIRGLNVALREFEELAENLKNNAGWNENE